MSDDIRIADDVLAWHDTVFDDIQTHLRNEGYIEHDEFVVSCQFNVIAEDGVYITDMNTVNGVQTHD